MFKVISTFIAWRLRQILLFLLRLYLQLAINYGVAYNRPFFGSDRSSRNANVRSFVCLSDEKSSTALNLHLSGSGLSQVSLRYVSGLSCLSPLDYFVGQTEP